MTVNLENVLPKTDKEQSGKAHGKVKTVAVGP